MRFVISPTKPQHLAFVWLSFSLVISPAIGLGQDTSFDEENTLKRLRKADDEQFVRLARTLSGLGIESQKIQSELAKKLTSKNVLVRAAAADAIPYLGPPTDETIDQLIESMKLGGKFYPDIRAYSAIVAEALVQIGPRCLPNVIDDLDTDNLDQYLGLTDVIHQLGPPAKAAVEKLIPNLKPGNYQWASAYALMGIGPDAKAAVPELTKMLESDRFNTVCIASRALSRIGPSAANAKEKLLQIAKEGNVSERGRALEALGGIGVGNDPDAKKLIIDGFSAFHQSLRERATTGVTLMQKAGKEFIPTLEKALQDPSYKPKPHAAYALYKVGGSKEVAIESLVESIKNPVFELFVIDRLGKMGADAAEAVPVLRSYLDKKDDGLRAEVIHTLFKIGIDAKTKKRLEQIAVEGEHLSARAAINVLRKLKAKSGDQSKPAKTEKFEFGPDM